MTSNSIELSGNLGDRHRRINDLVRDAYQQNLLIQDSNNPTDRLFAIDLASKQKNVDCILNSLKDDDMLYVSRALKSLWLLKPERANIINPSYLEHELFPQMTMQAVNKMRHWIQLHLRDPERCKEFYQFYKNRDFDAAAKFLWYCSNEYILGEVDGILEKLTPKLLKVLSEKVPKVTYIYYKNLKENQALLKYYLKNDSRFHANIKYLLKTDADVFFYVLENFFATGKFPAFSSKITKCIIKNYKSKFTKKPELYTSRLLNIETLAKNLGSEEIKQLVVKLAKAEYLRSWFTYKTVEPFIKRLSVEERQSFKKLVFVDKAFGESVKEWPYPLSAPPEIKIPETNLFEDTTIVQLQDLLYRNREGLGYGCAYLACGHEEGALCFKQKNPEKTLLNELFDKYRFSNYKQTLLELQKRLKAESSPQNRQYMLLVLISKTGGQTKDLVSFLDLLSYYKNEPVQIRATIVRSLVKRAFVWRLAPEHWARLLEWGHGLGLDGNPPEAACHEGLHAVVLRDLLAGVTPGDVIWKEYLRNFSTLAEYNLTGNERICLSTRLPAALLAAAKSDSEEASVRLRLLLDTLTAYRMRFDTFPGTVEAIKGLAESDFESAKDLLSKLYEAGVARNILIRENFALMQTDDSYVNVLRHDISILDDTTTFEKLMDTKNLKHEKFLRKLAVYFTEKDGLGERYRTVLELRAESAPDKILARPLALLSGSIFLSLLKVFESAPPKTPQRLFNAELRANAHVVRPTFDMDSFGWRALGAKAVANRVATCKQQDAERYFQETLPWSRTLRLSVDLSKRLNKEHEAFKVLASKRPGAALKSSLRYFQSKGNNLDPRIWNIVKSHIPKTNHRQLSYLATQYMESVPVVIKPEYCILVYKASKNVPDLEMAILSQIPSVLPELDAQLIGEEIDHFLSVYFKISDNISIHDKVNYMNYINYVNYILLFIGITARFLILSTSEEMLEGRIQTFGIPLLKQFELIKKVLSSDDYIFLIEVYLDTFLLSLRYNKVFFDDKYVSCLPVFERLTDWMHNVLPIEKWFEKYVTVHLTTIYFKTVRQCLKNNPELFYDEAKKVEEGPQILGMVFGLLLTNGIEELAHNSFNSITELFGKDLVIFFNDYFYNRRNSSVDKFTRAVIDALLTKESIASCVLAKHLFIAFRDKVDDEKFVNDVEFFFRESEIKELFFELDDSCSLPTVVLNLLSS